MTALTTDGTVLADYTVIMSGTITSTDIRIIIIIFFIVTVNFL